MTSRFTRPLLAACAILAVAAPSAAFAHGNHGHGAKGPKGHATGFGKNVRGVCKQIERGRTFHGLSAEQNQALADACTARTAAIKAANDAFVAGTQADTDAYKAVRLSVSTDLRTAYTAKRAACEADREAQACLDAKDAFKTTATALRTQLRDAYKAYIAAVRPALVTRNTAVRAAEQAFRTAVEQIRSQS
ncbi:MAG: hypothetical protein QOE08_376 [Thermoleophilaceae bacterium]|nr:hypothetical protein [Thermoleophilaceae bacterium]